ncbi:kinase-like protein [Obba rivulosa]|uniref:non-specific serine/threonine protein kinase n=1 Tax=Obba rivulosa TaxID=1052685 RepID=A0A8E2DLJ6_9APHY|nr:kinase-like protein [Obba rivulosa]
MSGLLSALRNSVFRRTGSRSTSAFSVVIARKNDQEPARRYEPGGYHPVNVGDIYNQRYQVTQQLGWGQYSTVWLVKDLQEQRQAAMKVLVGDFSNDTTGWDERGTLGILRDRNTRALGYGHICQLLDDFVFQGPNGSHICIVTELMGPTVLDIYHCMPTAMPLFLVKRISKHLLLALQYMHDDCNIVHTGDNIFMTGAPPPVAPAAIRLERSDLMLARFKLGDMGSSNKMSNRYAALIQPEALRSPEVIIGAEWDTKADIWNFGCLMYEFARGARLFDPGWNVDQTGMSRSQTHLAQTVGLLGEFPGSLIQKGKHAKRYFNDEGHLLQGAGQYGITLEDLLNRAGHPPEDIALTADFLSQALIIDPSKRWSATQLLQHPWLRHVD